VREPGGTEAGERVRAILKDQSVSLSSETEALLFAAARAELVSKVILPALAEGRVVVSDRFLDSSLAYQGGARGLGIERVEQLNDWIAGGLWPDVTFLLEVPPDVAGVRAGDEDRFEREDRDLQIAVAAAYDELAGRHADRYVPIDATRPPGEVHLQVLAEVEERRAGVAQ
jgi:dTMP kinase